MGEISYQWYIGEGPAAVELIQKISKAVDERERQVHALAAEYGAVACIQSGKNTIGLAYATPQNERWLKELKTIVHNGQILTAYAPRLSFQKGKELASRLKDLPEADFSDQIVSATGMMKAVLPPVGSEACIYQSYAGLCGNILFVRVPFTNDVITGQAADDQMPTPPAWMRPCQEAEALAAMDKESEREEQEAKKQAGKKRKPKC